MSEAQHHLLGRHLVADIEACNPESLDDEQYIVNLLEAAAIQVGATIIETRSHKFSPHGVTAFCMLAESHISIHTWPERGDAAMDCFTCGTMDPEVAGDFIALGLEGIMHTKQIIQRYGIDDVSVLTD